MGHSCQRVYPTAGSVGRVNVAGWANHKTCDNSIMLSGLSYMEVKEPCEERHQWRHLSHVWEPLWGSAYLCVDHLHHCHMPKTCSLTGWKDLLEMSLWTGCIKNVQNSRNFIVCLQVTSHFLLISDKEEGTLEATHSQTMHPRSTLAPWWADCGGEQQGAMMLQFLPPQLLLIPSPVSLDGAILRLLWDSALWMPWIVCGTGGHAT